MKKVSVTFSIPSETHRLLRSLVGQEKMNLFVAQAITQALQRRVECLKRMLTKILLEKILLTIGV